MNLSSKMVGLLIALSNPSDRVDQADSSSKSDREFTRGSRVKSVTSALIFKLLVTVLMEIGKARSRGQVSFSLSK